MSDLSTRRAAARPGMGKRLGRMRRWHRYVPVAVPVVLTIVVALVIAVIGAMRSPAAEQFTLRMRSSAPLSLAACGAEVATYGWKGRYGPPGICRVGQGRTWYHAVLVNRGADAYPACQATGFDASGKVVFSGALYFNFAPGLPGLYARGHRSTAFTWYLPKMSAPIARYATSCSVNEHPPI